MSHLRGGHTGQASTQLTCVNSVFKCLVGTGKWLKKLPISCHQLVTGCHFLSVLLCTVEYNAGLRNLKAAPKKNWMKSKHLIHHGPHKSITLVFLKLQAKVWFSTAKLKTSVLAKNYQYSGSKVVFFSRKESNAKRAGMSFVNCRWPEMLSVATHLDVNTNQPGPVSSVHRTLKPTLRSTAGNSVWL